MQRNLDIIKPWIAARKPFLLVGPEGCGKNMLRGALPAEEPTNCLPVTGRVAPPSLPPGH